MAHIKQQLTDDIKSAMLSKDALRLETLRGLKSVILYAEVAAGKREEGLDDAAILQLFAKESKKRTESAELYVKGGSPERAEKELAEKVIIDAYLPKQLTDEEVAALIDEAIASLDASGPQAMGRVIGAVKAKAGSAVDGGRLAQLVKERLS